MTHPNVWHDSSICVTWLIHKCGMTHPYVWHDSYISVTWLWLIHMCDICVISLITCVYTYGWDMSHIWMWHVTHMDLIHICSSEARRTCDICVTSHITHVYTYGSHPYVCKWGMLHVWIPFTCCTCGSHSHVARVDPIHMCANEVCHTYGSHSYVCKWGRSHVYTHMDETCHTYGWDMSHVWI